MKRSKLGRVFHRLNLARMHFDARMAKSSIAADKKSIDEYKKLLANPKAPPSYKKFAKAKIEEFQKYIDANKWELHKMRYGVKSVM